MWLAAPLAVLASAVAGLLLGLPTLRLRADYFAIVTIAFSEIVRYVATNEDRLTGGSQGTINLAGVGQGVAVQRRSGSASRAGCRAVLARRLEGRRDARDRLGRRARAAPALVCAGDPHAVGPGAASRSARTRTRRASLGQERVRVQAPGARARRRRSAASPASSTRGSSRSSARTTSRRCSPSSPG